MAAIQRIGGGVVGAGATAALRARVDEPGGSPYTQPSVLFGIGSGLVAGGLYLADYDIPVPDAFLAGHAVASVPLGITFAGLPKRAGVSTTDQVVSRLRLAAGQAGLPGGYTRRTSGSDNGGSDGSSGGNGSNGDSGSETETVSTASVGYGGTRRSVGSR